MADIRIAVVKFAVPTSTGTFDITDSSGIMGGATPKAAIFIMSAHFATNDPGVTASAQIGYGATDGTRQFGASYRDRDNQGTSDTFRQSNTTTCVYLRGLGANDTVGVFSAFGTNKITINLTAAPTVARLGLCILLGGADLSVRVGTTGALNGATPTAITGVGFEADAILTCAMRDSFSSTELSHAQIAFGCVVNDGSLTQRSIVHFAQDNAPNQSNSGYFTTVASTVQVDTAGINPTEQAITAIGSDGFTVGAGPTTQFGYVALNVAGDNVALATVTTPTSTGDTSHAIAGITPKFVMGCISSLDAVDTLENDTADAASAGCFAFNTAQQGAVVVSATDDSDNTDSESDCKGVALQCGISGAGAQAISATYVSMDSGGVTLNYSVTNGTGRKGWMFAVGTPGASGGGAGPGPIFRTPIFTSPAIRGAAH